MPHSITFPRTNRTRPDSRSEYRQHIRALYVCISARYTLYRMACVCVAFRPKRSGLFFQNNFLLPVNLFSIVYIISVVDMIHDTWHILRDQTTATKERIRDNKIVSSLPSFQKEIIHSRFPYRCLLGFVTHTRFAEPTTIRVYAQFTTPGNVADTTCVYMYVRSVNTWDCVSTGTTRIFHQNMCISSKWILHDLRNRSLGNFRS